MAIHSSVTIDSPAEITRSTTGKRERILRAAIDVFARAGYFNARVSEIAKEASVADGTIYLYFENKEDLLVTIFREYTTRYLQLLTEELRGEESPEVCIRKTIRFHLELLSADRALAVVFQVELRHSLKFMSLFSHGEVGDYLDVLRTYVERGQAAGVFNSSLHPRLVAKAIFGIMDEMVTSWVLSERDYSLGEQADGVATLVLRGLLS